MKLIVFDNDSGKARGGRPTWVVLDEVGSWSGGAKLKDCYKGIETSMNRGVIRTGTVVMFGTGGEMKSGGSEDAKDKIIYTKTLLIKILK